MYFCGNLSLIISSPPLLHMQAEMNLYSHLEYFHIWHAANLQRQMYTSTALYTSRFRTTMKTPDNPLDTASRRNLLPKHSFVLLMAFEAAVNLERWNELQGIIEVLIW